MRLSDMVGVLVRGTAVGGLQGVATTFHMCVVDITFQASRVLPSIVALRLYALRHVHVSRLCPVDTAFHVTYCDMKCQALAMRPAIASLAVLPSAHQPYLFSSWSLKIHTQ